MTRTGRSTTLHIIHRWRRSLEAAGAHILGIKDMAGLLKPQAAYELVSALKETIDIPVHLHTHDTSGNGIYMYAKAVEAGVDIIDVAVRLNGGINVTA